MNCSFIDFGSQFEKPFTGCDGKPHSDEFLKYLLNKAIEDEDYRYCASVKSELDRRETKRLIGILESHRKSVNLHL